MDNSLLSKIDELKALISYYPIDIIALNEIKPKYGEIPSHEALNIKGYDLFTSDFLQADTRGVCIYVKSHLSATQIIPNSNTTLSYNDCVWVTIAGDTGVKLLFGCVYRSGTPATAKKYDDALFANLLWASKERNEIHKIIVGDLICLILAGLLDLKRI